VNLLLPAFIRFGSCLESSQIGENSADLISDEPAYFGGTNFRSMHVMRPKDDVPETAVIVDPAGTTHKSDTMMRRAETLRSTTPVTAITYER